MMSALAHHNGRPPKFVDKVKRQTKLRDLRVSRLTLLRYRDAVQAFLIYEQSVYAGVARDLESLDEHAASFVEALWEENVSQSSRYSHLNAVI